MTKQQTAPYGTWRSSISAASLAASAIGMSDLRVQDGCVYWRESRPDQGGRQVLMRRSGDGRISEISPDQHSVRTRVHEYGGNAYVLIGEEVVYVSFADQRLYQLGANGNSRALTPQGFQYSDLSYDPQHRLILAVREDHRAQTLAEHGEERSEIVAIGLSPQTAGDGGRVLRSGDDFYAWPRLSADGRRLAWIAWNHPDMPWDRAALNVADYDGNALSNIQALVDAPRRAANEPCWSAEGALYYIDDPQDWWNLYRYADGNTVPVLPMSRELGGPLWTLGGASYALLADGGALLRSSVGGVDRLDLLSADGAARQLSLPFDHYDEIALLDEHHAVALAGSAQRPPLLIQIDLRDGSWSALHQPTELSVSADCLSTPQAISFPTAGEDGQPRQAHAWYYPPTNPHFAAPADQLPPLIVTNHGGPTAAAGPQLNMRTQYWTSRGFAVVDVNYGGSTGYGRAYRERLLGQWGVVDVADAVAAVDHLVGAGLADPKRVAIRGGSAGGYTALAALAFSDRFRAGANLYGVADIASLAASCHKFERHYVVSLVGPPGSPLYDARSPLKHLDGFNAPLITLQGSDDRVVPPEQSRMIVAALKAKGVPHAYIEFPGEQHGFRQAANIIRAQEAELWFYGYVFGFESADEIEAVTIS